LGVWVLDGAPSHSNLLRFALNESTLRDTTVLLTASMTTPWSIVDQLQAWAGILHDHIDGLNLHPDSVKELRARAARRWANYVEPGEHELDVNNKQGGGTTPGSNPRGSRHFDAEEDVLQEGEDIVLPNNVLSRNTGIDIVVVITKVGGPSLSFLWQCGTLINGCLVQTDHVVQLERESEYRDEHFDFLQWHVRRFCAAYGAAVFYTSVKEDKNCDLLYKYLVHRIYGLPFRTPALIVEKDAVFM
jgi:dynein light intermediate chain 1